MAQTNETGMSSTLQIMYDDLNGLVQDLGSALNQSGDVSASKLLQRAEQIRDDVQTLLSEASDSGRELMRQTHLDDVAETVSDVVRDRPLTSLAAAAGVGMYLGAKIWSGRSNGYAADQMRR